MDPTATAARLEVAGFGPDDADGVAAWVAINNAVRAADAPWSVPLTLREAEGILRHGWDGEVGVPFVGRVEGVPVVTGALYASDYDNLHSAWVHVHVHPDHRRRGHGTLMLQHLTEQALDRGRTLLGTDGWDHLAAPAAFCARHGFEAKARGVNRRQHLADVDWARVEALHADALEHAAAYELVRRVGATPEAALEAVATMTAAINDAPTDDLEIEDEVFSVERVRAYEGAQLARGMVLHRVLARDRATGELAGHSIVTVDPERPELGDQHDTSVVRAHRGHRLGLLLKTDMNLWLRESQPQLTQIDTWNAESNAHMIAVNERLGYRVMGREIEYQKHMS